MKKVFVMYFVVVSYLVFGGEVDFQSGKFGVTTTTNISSWWIGGAVHVASFLALRPAIRVYYGTYEWEDKLYSELDKQSDINIGLSLDILYFFKIAGRMFAYLGPRATYEFYKYDMDWDSGSEEKYFHRSVSVGLLFGPQFMISEQFGIFLDISIEMDWDSWETEETDPNDTIVQDDITKSWSLNTLRGALGVVFYFN